MRALIKAKLEKMESSKKYINSLTESTNQIRLQIETLNDKDKSLNEEISKLDAEYTGII